MVDLPQPEGPTKATNSFSRMENEISRSAVRLPRPLVWKTRKTFSNSIAGATGPGCIGCARRLSAPARQESAFGHKRAIYDGLRVQLVERIAARSCHPFPGLLQSRLIKVA